MKNRLFELSKTLIGKIECVLVSVFKSELDNDDRDPVDRDTRREPRVSLELIETFLHTSIRIDDLDSLRTLRDELDKVLFIAEAMTIDQKADEGSVRDLYGNGITIKYALEKGLLKETEKESSAKTCHHVS